MHKIASEVGELILIHLQGGELEINSPPIQQSDWSIVTSHGTIYIIRYTNGNILRTICFQDLNFKVVFYRRFYT